MKTGDKIKLDWGVLALAVGPRVRLLRNVLTARALAAQAPFGLPSGTLSIMALIAANEGCSQTVLARVTGLNKSAVVGILDELEKGGLAQRTIAPNDRRRNALSLTGKGDKLLDEMQRAANAQEAQICKELSAEELAQLLALLDRAYDAVAPE